LDLFAVTLRLVETQTPSDSVGESHGGRDLEFALILSRLGNLGNGKKSAKRVCLEHVEIRVVGKATGCGSFRRHSVAELSFQW